MELKDIKINKKYLFLREKKTIHNVIFSHTQKHLAKCLRHGILCALCNLENKPTT